MRSFVTVLVLASSLTGFWLVGPVTRAAEPRSEVVFLGRKRALTGIDEVLAKPIPLRFLETPLRDVLVEMQDKTDVAVTADFDALDDAGCDIDQQLVTFEAENTPLASSLDALCEFLELEWIVQDDVIEITTPEGAVSRQVTWIIDVTDITQDAESLGDLVESVVHPESWARNGGEGVIRCDEIRDASTLIVTNTWQVQRTIAGLLDRIRRCVANPETEHTPLGVEGYWSDAAAGVAARKALAAPMTLELVETPLRDFGALVAEKGGVPVTFDWRALDAEAIDVDGFLLTGSGRGLRLARLFERLLAPHELTWDLRHDRMTITTVESANEHLTIAVYPIASLLEKGRSVSKLIETLQAAVTPDAWEEAGGAAFLRAFKHRENAAPCVLIVRHTSAGHKVVDEFLKQLPR